MTPGSAALRSLACAMGLLPLLLLAACGGGGGGESVPTLPDAPETVVYDVSDALYRVDSAITPNLANTTGGEPDTFVVDPALPTGLALAGGTGGITGTPTETTPRQLYTVTASNDGGEASTTLMLEVRTAEAVSLLVKESLDEDDLRHFLIRTHWGVRGDWLADLQTRGLEAYLEDMLDFPAIGSTNHEQDAALLLLRENDPLGQEGMFPSRTQLQRWWIYLMKENPNPFQEVLAFMWHDHFATSQEVLSGGRLYYMKNHVDMLRERGIGSVRDLLLAVSRDWAMLWWLDGYVSTGRAPNENYAREFLELFSLGVDQNYFQVDIVTASRAFTGWQDVVLDSETGLRQMVFVPGRHDDEDKVIFGQTITGQNDHDDFEAMVNITIDNRPVAEWLVRRLLESFCFPNPEDALVDQLAQVMRDADYEIAPVLTALFRSEAFYSPEARRSLVKGPVEHAMGFMHSTGLRIRISELSTIFNLMGNLPTMPPTVDGWPGGPQWLSAQGMVDRANVLQIAISYGPSIDEQELNGLDLRALLPAGTPTSLECVDALALLLGIALDATERTRLAEYLDTDRLSDGSVVDDPFDASDADMVDERIRGLLYILGQHPTYMLR